MEVISVLFRKRWRDREHVGQREKEKEKENKRGRGDRPLKMHNAAQRSTTQCYDTIRYGTVQCSAVR